MTTAIDYEDRRFCPRCQSYVRYLLAVHEGYCVGCGNLVRLFSEEDHREFLAGISASTRRFSAVRLEGADQSA